MVCLLKGFANFGILLKQLSIVQVTLRKQSLCQMAGTAPN
jgi:hypothetical protein